MRCGRPALVTARHRVLCGHAQPSLASRTHADAHSSCAGSRPVVPCGQGVRCSSWQASQASRLSARRPCRCRPTIYCRLAVSRPLRGRSRGFQTTASYQSDWGGARKRNPKSFSFGTLGEVVKPSTLSETAETWLLPTAVQLFTSRPRGGWMRTVKRRCSCSD